MKDLIKWSTKDPKTRMLQGKILMVLALVFFIAGATCFFVAYEWIADNERKAQEIEPIYIPIGEEKAELIEVFSIDAHGIETKWVPAGDILAIFWKEEENIFVILERDGEEYTFTDEQLEALHSTGNIVIEGELPEVFSIDAHGNITTWLPEVPIRAAKGTPGGPNLLDLPAGPVNEGLPITGTMDGLGNITWGPPEPVNLPQAQWPDISEGDLKISGGDFTITTEDDDWIAIDEPFKICPECKKQGLKSTLSVFGGTSTLMAWSPYFDENGRFHSHDPNIHTDYRKCSNGHQFKAKYTRRNCAVRDCERLKYR